MSMRPAGHTGNFHHSQKRPRCPRCNKKGMGVWEWVGDRTYWRKCRYCQQAQTWDAHPTRNPARKLENVNDLEL